MKTAYGVMYLEDATRILGEAFGYAADFLKVDMTKFTQAFIDSGIAHAFESRSPKYITGMSGAELALRVLGIKYFPVDPSMTGFPGRAYWCGWILAYFQWRTHIPFKDILPVLNYDFLYHVYNPLHKASDELVVKKLKDIFDRKMSEKFR